MRQQCNKDDKNDSATAGNRERNTLHALTPSREQLQSIFLLSISLVVAVSGVAIGAQPVASMTGVQSENYISAAETTGSVDDDNDGYHSDFDILVQADTNLNTGTGSATDPYFAVEIAGEEVATTDVRATSGRYEISIEKAALEALDLERDTHEVNIELRNSRPGDDSVSDEQTISVQYESEELKVISNRSFTEEFESGLNGWNVTLHPNTGPAVTEGAVNWSEEYNGSVRLDVDGGPNHIGVYRGFAGIEARTKITANYESPDLDGEPGGPRLLLHLPDGNETIRLDRDGGRQAHNGTLTGTVPRALPNGTELEVRLGVRPGEITTYVTNVTVDPDSSSDATGTDTGGSDVIDIGPNTAPSDTDDSEPPSPPSDSSDDDRADEDGTGLERVTPASGEVTVAPGTRVLFESEAPDGLEYGDAEWTADNGRVAPVFPSMHHRGFTDNAAWGTFETSGTYDVRTVLPDEHGGGTVNWTVHVESGGAGPPAIEEIRSDPPAEGGTTANDTIEIDATARDSDGGSLDRIIWVEQTDGTVAEVSDVSGERDVATLTVDAKEWMGYGNGIAALAITDDGRASDSESHRGPDVRPPFEVDIVETNDTVRAGDPLNVVAEITNTRPGISGGESTQDIELLANGERVANDSVTITAGQTESVSLSAETDSGPVGEVNVTVRSPDDEDATTVTVEEAEQRDDRPAEPTVGVENVTEVGTGTYEVTFAYENPNDAALPSGAFVTGSTADTPPSELEPGADTFTVEWTPEADDERLVWEVDLSSVGYDDPVRAETDPAGEYDAPNSELEVTAVDVASPIKAGTPIEATVTVENAGDEEGTQEVAVLIGGQVADRRTVTLAGGGTETITAARPTTVDDGGASMTVTARTEDGLGEATVRIQNAEPEPESEPASESESETEPAPESEPETEPVSESESETESAPESESETEPAPESEPETEPASESEPETETQPAPGPETESNQASEGNQTTS